jgi:hypothetical protein
MEEMSEETRDQISRMTVEELNASIYSLLCFIADMCYLIDVTSEGDPKLQRWIAKRDWASDWVGRLNAVVEERKAQA